MLRSDHSAFFSLRLLALFAALAVGCTPKIGDKCTVSTDCSPTGDRLCDITQPGGYCTEFNCEPDGCPDNAACINFGTVLSPVLGCSTSQGNSPYQRSFCMASCSSNSDCRSGYRCDDLSGTTPNRLGAVLADYAGSGKVCTVESAITDPSAKPSADAEQVASDAVCLGSDAGPLESSAGGAASGGSGGASGGAGGANSPSGGASGADDAGAGG